MTVGVICEYNPFHMGHGYHLSKIREKYGDDCRIVCLMNGNFVQRGTPAVFDKYVRAYAAVNAGADVVLELPYPYGCAGAEYYARSAVSVLCRLGMDVLSFGCESSLDELSGISGRAGDESIGHEIGKLTASMSYARAREIILCEDQKQREILSLPNNILAIEYIRALNRQAPNTEIFAVKRLGDYKGTGDSGFAGATQIRSALARGETEKSRDMCGDSFALYEPCIKEHRMPSYDYFSKALISALNARKDSSFLSFECNTELRDRICRYGALCNDYNELVDRCRTARYTKARVRRALLHTALGTPSDATNTPPGFALVLSFSEKGREVLRGFRKKTDITVLTKPANAFKLNTVMQKQVDMWSGADRFYALLLDCPTQGDIFIRSTPFCAR